MIPKKQFAFQQAQLREKEKEYTGACSVCGLKMWQRDVEYSKHKYGKVVCRDHVTVTTLFDHIRQPVKMIESTHPEMQSTHLEGMVLERVVVDEMATVEEQEMFMDQPGGVDNIPF